MSVPGVGILAALRRKSQPQPEPAMETSKFSASGAAVHALEQAVAAGASADAASRKAAKGCRVQAAEFVFDLDAAHPGEVPSELTFAPVTRVKSDYKEARLRQVAVSGQFITYGLKQGHIRVLHFFSEARALLKGHTGPIADICFAGENIVAAGGQDGQLYAWQLSVHDGDNAIHAEQILRVKFSPGCDAASVFLAAIPGAVPTVAAAVSNAVVMLQLPSAASEAVLEVDPLDPASTEGVFAQKMPNFSAGDTPTAVAASSDGRYIAAGSKHAVVYVAHVGSDGTLAAAGKFTAAPFDAGKAVSAVEWLASEGANGTVLVATANGTRQTMFSTTDNGASFSQGASVTLQGKTPSYIHTTVVREQQVVVLADTPRKAIYTLHWAAATASAAPRFDYLARFRVGMPVLNFCAVWNPDRTTDSGDEGVLDITCVQTEAVQQYLMDPALCSEEGGAVEDGVAAAAAPAAAAAQPQLSAYHSAESYLQPQLSAALSVKSYPEEECPSPPSTPVEPAVAVVQVPVPLPLPVVPPPQAEPPVPESLPSPTPAAGPPPPKLLTPTDFLRARSVEPQPKAPLMPSPPPAAPTVRVLQRNPPAPAPSAAEDATVVASCPEPLEASASSTVALPAAATGASSAEVAAAVAHEMANVHRKFTGHVSMMFKELLKAVKSEMDGQSAANARLIKEAAAAQAAAAAAERAAVLAEERAHMERLLAAISTTLNRDVPARLAEALRAELGDVATSLATSLTPAVQDAVAAALPKETSAAVKAALDKQLGASLQAGLNKPIQEAFRTAFSKQVVPSFESACQSMFMQMDKTFTKGFAEHLEAFKAGAGESGGGSEASRSTASTPAVRSPKDAKAELRALLAQNRFEEAFSRALGLQDIAIVAWLCNQTDAASVLSTSPPALSQMVVLSLVQQLAADLASAGASNRLQWIREAALALNPQDPQLTPHLKPVLEQVYAGLGGAAARLQGADLQSCKLAMHVVHSQMSS